MSATPIHFKNARLIDPEAGTDSIGELLVVDGVIAAKGETVDAPEGADVVDCDGKALAPGIIDMNVFVGEPGFKHKESYRTAGRAAAAGGVTTICAQPGTEPAIDDPAVVQFVQKRAEEVCPVNVKIMGALTQKLEGQLMSEMGLMQDAGCVAFTDMSNIVKNPSTFRKCLNYAKYLDALVIHHPQEATFAAGGIATAGFFSTKLGLAGVPRIAERMGLERDMALVESTGARYHADQISTGDALDVLRRAKEKGLKVTASASIHHLTLNEYDIGDYRSYFKFDPPLRAEEDREALVAALAEGLIDAIVSVHTPEDEEEKRLPFETAATGAVGLETILSASLQLVHAGALDLPTLFARLATGPAKILGLDSGRLSVGAPADLVLFDVDSPYVLDRSKLESRSKNTPYDLRRMQGRVVRTVVGGETVFEQAG